MKLYSEQNFGEVVACDWCNYGEESLGGALLGSYAVCGDCVEHKGILKDDYPYKDEIDRIFDQTKTFRENVIAYRKEVYGTGDAIQRIYTDDD